MKSGHSRSRPERTGTDVPVIDLVLSTNPKDGHVQVFSLSRPEFPPGVELRVPRQILHLLPEQAEMIAEALLKAARRVRKSADA